MHAAHLRFTIQWSAYSIQATLNCCCSCRPLLRMALPASALDVALLLPLVYSVGVLGAGNSDVAARASAALLRVRTSSICWALHLDC